jgi:hypothetical protein
VGGAVVHALLVVSLTRILIQIPGQVALSLRRGHRLHWRRG